MRKIFTLFAAMLVALTVNATPAEVLAGSGTLKTAITAASSGDTLLLKSTGDYIETATIEIGKSLTFIADAGKTPVIKSHKLAIKSGARVEFKGINFDASAADSDHQFAVYDATAGNKLILDGCNIYGFALNSSLIHCGSSEAIDSVVVNNCDFRNCLKSIIFNENTGTVNIKVTNTTFANISTNASSYYAGVIDSRAASGFFRVDNCTFYNVQVMSTGYAAVGQVKTTGGVVANCIFAFPTAASSNYRAVRDKVTVNNCLIFNYTADSYTGLQSDVTANNCIFDKDPLFADTANCIFTLAETSPAKGAGVGGTHLGDPRWWPSSWKPAEVVEVTSIELNKTSLNLEVDDVELLTATVLPDNATDPSVSWTSSNTSIAEVSGGLVSGKAIGTASIIATAGSKSDTCTVTITAATKPSTDFASALTLLGKKAHLNGAIWKMYKNDTYKLYGDGGSNHYYGTATWTIHVEKPCFVTGTLNGVEGGHMFALDLYQGEDSIGTIAQTKENDWSSGEIAMDSTGYSTLLFPAAGDYTLKLRNTQEWSSGKVASITLTLDESKVVKLKGSWDSWLAEQEFTLSADGLTATKTKSLNKNSEPEFKIWVGGDERANGCWFKRDVTSTTLPGSGSNMKIVTDYTGEYVLTWTFATNTLSVTFPEPELENGWYLVGTFNGIDKWTVNDLSSTDKFGVNPANEDEFMITKDLKKDDRFKAVYVYLDELQSDSWKPADGDGYVVTAGQAGDAKAIYFRVNYYDSWNGHFYITDSPSTSLDNVLDTEKTVKAIENGQLVIIKNGVRYNVIGSVIR